MVRSDARVPVPTGVVVLLVVVALLGARVDAKLAVAGRAVPELWAMQDFRNAVYYPALAVSEGINPYDRAAYVARFEAGAQGFPAYSPLSVLLHAPLAVLPYQASAWAYFVLLVALTLATAALAAAWAGLPRGAGEVALVAALMLASRPGYMNLLNGQITLQLVLGTLLALEYGRRRPLLAAVGLALASLKPTYAFPLALLLLAQHRVRAALLGMLLAGLGAGLGAWWIARSCDGWGSFFRVLLANLAGSGAASTAAAVSSWTRIDAAALAARLLQWEPGWLGSTLIATGVLAVAVLAMRRPAVEAGEDGALGPSGLLASLALLVAVYHQPYDVLLLAPAVLALLAGRDTGQTARRGLRTAVAAMLVVPFVDYLATDTVLRGFEPSSLPWTVIVSVNAAALAVAYLLVAGAALAGRPVLPLGRTETEDAGT